MTEMFNNRDYLAADAILVIPVGVPLPMELEGVEVATGTLYDRLRPLCTEHSELMVSPLSGAELVALTASWNLLVLKHRPYTFTGLPGTRQDVTFDHACRVLGIRALDWQELSAEVAERVLERQRASAAPPVEGAVGGEPGARTEPQRARAVYGKRGGAGVSPHMGDHAKVPPPPVDDDWEDDES